MGDWQVEGLGGSAERAFLAGTVGATAAELAALGVVLEPGVLASPVAARAALSAGQRLGRDVMAVPDGSVSTPGAGLFVPHGGGPVGPERIAAAERVSFDALERELPSVGGAPMAVADAWVFRVEHWSDLLWANLRALGPFLWAELATGPRLAWAALRAGSFRPELVGGHLSRLGPGAFVHPSATVEFSLLGPGARVGAGAVVRGSVLGEGAAVEELAMVEGCVLGPGARIQRQAMAKYSVIEREAAHAGVVQLGVIGARAQVRQGAVLFDQSLGEPVRVSRGGALVPAPRGMIGVCVGTDSVVGQGVRVAAGRCLPPGLTLLTDPDGVVTRVDLPAGTTRARVRDGRMEPLS